VPEREHGRELGARLRRVRVQQQLSLQQAAAASGGAVTPSLLSAYERGERRVTVHRLQQLADLYHVGVDELLPNMPRVVDVRPADDKVRLDLDALRASDDEFGRAALRFGETILRRRHDLNGRVVTLRATDLDALAAAQGVSAERLLEHLGRSGLVDRVG
jgi:transcriptional regulator with XRE-family HTH domain